jgi:hypothetical protein
MVPRAALDVVEKNHHPSQELNPSHPARRAILHKFIQILKLNKDFVLYIQYKYSTILLSPHFTVSENI